MADNQRSVNNHIEASGSDESKPDHSLIPSCIQQAEFANLESFRRKGKHRYRCPLCNDPGNLSLYPEAKDNWYCYNCHEKGGRVSFYYALQGENVYREYRAGNSSEITFTPHKIKRKQPEKFESLESELLIPEDSLSVLWETIRKDGYTEENTRPYISYWNSRAIDPCLAWSLCLPVVEHTVKAFSCLSDDVLTCMGLSGYAWIKNAGKGFLIPLFDSVHRFPVSYRYRPYIPGETKEYSPRGSKPDMLLFCQNNFPELAIKTEGLPDLLSLASIFPEAMILASLGSAPATFDSRGRQYKTEYKYEGSFRIPNWIDISNIKYWLHLGHFKEGTEDNTTSLILQETISKPVIEILTPEKNDWNNKLQAYGKEELRTFLMEKIRV